MTMTTSSEFVAQFYDLKGDSIPERKKNFFKLLKAQPEPLNEENLKTLIPRTYLESLFQIDIFIYFKIITKLSEILKGGNEVFISKILRHPFLLREIIGDVSAENFVNDVLPCMSYAMRMKVLKKISFFLEESQMDDIFSCVHKRYGFDIAKKILHTCSSQKIIDFLSEHDVMLKPRQIKYIFDKNPELLIVYLKHYKSVTGKAFAHKSLGQHIAQKNPKMWVKLRNEKLTEMVTLGGRTSEHYIKEVVSDLQTGIIYYSGFLKMSTIIRSLRGHFEEIYLECFPRDVTCLCPTDFGNRLLKYYPKQKRWDLFAQTYSAVFGKDILNDLINLDNGFREFLPNKATVNKWAELKYNNTKDNEMLKYCDPKLAIPLLKEKINVTSDIHQRRKLLLLLVKTCTQNKDEASLEEVLKYICFRHRNEDTVRGVLYQIRNSLKLEEFGENHWNYVKEMIGFLKIKTKWYIEDTCEFTPKYLEYLILHGKPFKKEVCEFIRELESAGSDFNFNFENAVVKKLILIEIFKTYPELKLVDENVLRERQECFVEIIIDFNVRNPDHALEVLQFPYLYTYLKSLLSEDYDKLTYGEQSIVDKLLSYNLKFPEKPIIPMENSQMLTMFNPNIREFCLEESIVLLVKKKNRSDFEQQALQLVWDNLLENYQIRVKIVPWFIDNEPRIVLPHIDRILMVDPPCIDMKTARLMSHLALDRKIIDFFTDKLKCIDQLKENVKKKAPASDTQVDSEVQVKLDVDFYWRIIEGLSILLSTKEYIEIVVRRFLPEKEKIGVADEELTEFYRLQRKVAGSFTKVQEPAHTLPVLMEFCAGDYLQSALPSLYSVFYKTPEKLLYLYMDILSKRAVSARKHPLSLSSQLLPYDYVLAKIRNSNETNVSSQKHVFSSALKYFQRNPCEELLKLVISRLYVIDKSDLETFERLVYIEVPEKYTVAFKQACWYFFEDLRKKGVAVRDYLVSLLQCFIDSRNLLDSLPLMFGRHIVANYFGDKLEKDYVLYNITNFVSLFLRFKSEQSENFKIVFNTFLLLKNRNDTETIKNIFYEFYNSATNEIKENYKIDMENNYHIELFTQHWYNLYTPIEMFDEHVLLSLLYLKSKSCCNVETYAKEVGLFLKKLIVQYGPYIHTIFRDLFYVHEVLTVREKYVFLYNMLTFDKTTSNCIFVIHLMQSHCSDDVPKDIRRNIIQILESSNEPVVAIHLKKFNIA